jgi:DNA-binding response OmpR family regulator
MDTIQNTALIVEDDPKLQIAMSEQLRHMGLDVLVANHYDAALRHLEVGALHVVCIDVGLPNKSGYELCEHIRGSLRLLGLPILMTSDHGDPGQMAYAEDAGANAFLHKPFSMLQLADCIESLLSVSLAAPAALSFGPPAIMPSIPAIHRGHARTLAVRRPTQDAKMPLFGTFAPTVL